jgi:4-methyl-5(b-hydroxyethyl)-thiazole monophosphate biosynthesis
MSDIARTALIILFDGVEEIEAVTTIDLLRRAHVLVTVAHVGPQPQVTGRSEISIDGGTPLSIVSGGDYDVVILPGGPGVKNLRASVDVIRLLEDQSAAGKLVAAICAAPTVLKDAGLLQGRRFTAHPSVAAELPDLIATEAVIRDDIIITSRGAGTAIPFALAIIRALTSDAEADRVATAICYPNQRP